MPRSASKTISSAMLHLGMAEAAEAAAAALATLTLAGIGGTFAEISSEISWRAEDAPEPEAGL